MAWDVNNKRIVDDVSLSDISEAVDYDASLCLEDLIQYGTINPMSKNKPIIASNKLTISTADKQAVRYGFGTESNNLIPTLGVNLDSRWVYTRPRGLGAGINGRDECYRTSDFLNYYADAICPLKTEIEECCCGGDYGSAGSGWIIAKLSLNGSADDENKYNSYNVSIQDLVSSGQSAASYNICFVIWDLRTNTKNFIVTRHTFSSISGNTFIQILYQSQHEEGGRIYPAIPLINSDNVQDTIRVIACLKNMSVPNNYEYLVYTDNDVALNVPNAYSLRISGDTNDVGIGCDRASKLLSYKYTMLGTTGTTSLTTTYTNETIQNPVARKFTYNVGANINTTNCVDWSSISRLSVDAIIRIYVLGITSGSGACYMSYDGDPSHKSTSYSEGYDENNHLYFEYTKTIGLASQTSGQIFNFSALGDTNHTDYLYLLNAGTSNVTAALQAEITLKQKGSDDIILSRSQTVNIQYDNEYTISNMVIHYSSGDKIKADGSNYAWITATVQYRNNTPQDNVIVIPVVENNAFYIYDNYYIKGYNLEDNVTQETSVEIQCYYETSGNISLGPNNLLKQEANICTETFSNVSLSGIPSNQRIGCMDTSFSVVASNWTRSRSYTSNYPVSSDSGGTLNLYLNGTNTNLTISSGETVTISNVGTNQHSENTRSFTVIAKNETESVASITFRQAADSKTETSSTPGQYIMSTRKTLDNISASGGSATIEVDAYQEIIIHYVWDSDGSEAPSSTGVSENEWSVSVSTSSNRFSYEVTEWHDDGDIFEVSHDDMEDNIATDSITFTFLNLASNNVTSSVSLSATNAIVYYLAPDFTLEGRLDSNSWSTNPEYITIPATGGTVTGRISNVKQKPVYTSTYIGEYINLNNYNLSWGSAGSSIQRSALPATPSDETTIGYIEAIVSANGSSSNSKSFVVKQAENRVVSTSWGALNLTGVTLSCDTIPAWGARNVMPEWSNDDNPGKCKQNCRITYTSGNSTVWHDVDIIPQVTWSVPEGYSADSLGNVLHNEITVIASAPTATFVGNNAITASLTLGHAIVQDKNIVEYTDTIGSPSTHLDDPIITTTTYENCQASITNVSSISFPAVGSNELAYNIEWNCSYDKIDSGTQGYTISTQVRDYYTAYNHGAGDSNAYIDRSEIVSGTNPYSNTTNISVIPTVSTNPSNCTWLHYDTLTENDCWVRVDPNYGSARSVTFTIGYTIGQNQPTDSIIINQDTYRLLDYISGTIFDNASGEYSSGLYLVEDTINYSNPNWQRYSLSGCIKAELSPDVYWDWDNNRSANISVKFDTLSNNNIAIITNATDSNGDPAGSGGAIIVNNISISISRSDLGDTIERNLTKTGASNTFPDAPYYIYFPRTSTATRSIRACAWFVNNSDTKELQSDVLYETDSGHNWIIIAEQS